MHKLLLAAFLLTLIGCTADTPATEETTSPSPAATTTSTTALTASTLSTYPTEHILECGCTLRLEASATKDRTDNLFFVFNWQSGPGVIALNGQDYLVQRGASLGTGGKDNVYASYLHQSDQFSIQTSLTNEGPAEDTGTRYSGKVRITHLETGEKLVAKVTGSCSC